MVVHRNKILPTTPKGILRMIESTGLEKAEKAAEVLGGRNIVGKPVAQLLLQKDATVTVCHSKTENIGELTKQADILVVAIGKPRFVTKGMVKPGAVVIDVGTSKVYDKVVGDCDFESVKMVAGWLTPDIGRA